MERTGPAHGDDQLSLDKTLLSTYEKYGSWMDDEKIPAAGRVIPVRQAVPTAEWIMPTHQAVQLLRRSDLFALTECVCRSRYGRCDRPTQTCLVLDEVAEQHLAEGKARRLPLEEAAGVLEKAQESGLIHMTYYRPQNRAWVVCSCCDCCCMHLQLLHRIPAAQRSWILKSDYVVTETTTECKRCGRCEAACSFGCLKLGGDGVEVNHELCFGCGHCATVCPSGHLQLQHRDRRGCTQRVDPDPGRGPSMNT